MPDTSQLVIGADLAGQPIAQAMRLANRHGLIAGATGTGKTVTLQRLAEAFSDAGVAVLPLISRVTCAASAPPAILRARSPSASPGCPGSTTSRRRIR